MKITKKVIKESPEYIMTLDPKSCGANNVLGFYKALGCDLYYKTMSANNILDAMTEAEEYFNETTYIITIAQKTGESDSDTEGVVYKEVLTTRGNGAWHKTDKDHSETPAKIAYNPEFKFFQLLCTEY